MPAGLAELLDVALRAGHCSAEGPDERLDAAGLDALAAKTALDLKQRGALPSEPVAVLMANRPADIGVLLGVWRTGAVAVPVNAAAPEAVLAELKASVGARFIIGPSGIDGSGPSPASRALLEDAALVIFTSGSTGRPKKVVIGHQRFAAKLDALQRLLIFRAGDVILVPLQLTFIFGLWVSLLALRAGARLILMPRFSVSGLTQLFESGVTIAGLVPTMLRSLPADALPPAPKLRQLLTGGEPFGAALAAKIRAAYLQTEIFDLYGSTETGSCDFCFNSRDPRRQGAIGAPTEGVAFRIVADAITGSALGGADGGRAAQAGNSGELQIRTPFGMLGYLDDPELTAASFDNGFFRTGDLARMRADGLVELVGRKKEIISRGGIKIAPLELDVLFAGHPDVEAVLCGAVADERRGEAVHLLVVRRKGAALDAGQLMDWAAIRIERGKLPDAIHFVEQLPLGTTGKADRSAVSRVVAAIRGAI